MNISCTKISSVIAEDDAPTRQLLASYLSSFEQVEITATVDNSRQVLETVRKLAPAAVFLDVEMPGLDGLSTSALIRENIPKLCS